MLNEKQQHILEQFNSCYNWEKKYMLIIKKGKELPELDESLKTEENKVQGCQSQVWIAAELDENKNLVFKADSDAMIVKGLVSLLLELYSGAKPEVIISTEPEFIHELGLGSHLSPSRANGLLSMVKKIKYYAMAYQALLARA